MKPDDKDTADTIFSLSSGGRGVRAGVAVIRISGPGARQVLVDLTEKQLQSETGTQRVPFPVARKATFRTLYGYPTSASCNPATFSAQLEKIILDKVSVTERKWAQLTHM
jgi:hypothetical protein